jgi:hypothetical protein
MPEPATLPRLVLVFVPQAVALFEEVVGNFVPHRPQGSGPRMTAL